MKTAHEFRADKVRQLLQAIAECRGTLIDVNTRKQVVDWMAEADGLLRKAADELRKVYPT